MLRPQIRSFLPLGVALTVAGMLAACAEGVTVAAKKVPGQVVLYTVYRGSYEKSGQAVGQLFGLAIKKGVKPIGPITYVYLNSPRYLESQHWLTEIQLPVTKEALALAGTLGEMTDVKTLRPRMVAVAGKPEGQADPGPIWGKLYSWIWKEGYVAADGAFETFLTNVESGEYAKMRSEIMVPIERLTTDKGD